MLRYLGPKLSNGCLFMLLPQWHLPVQSLYNFHPHIKIGKNIDNTPLVSEWRFPQDGHILHHAIMNNVTETMMKDSADKMQRFIESL